MKLVKSGQAFLEKSFNPLYTELALPHLLVQFQF